MTLTFTNHVPLGSNVKSYIFLELLLKGADTVKTIPLQIEMNIENSSLTVLKEFYRYKIKYYITDW